MYGASKIINSFPSRARCESGGSCPPDNPGRNQEPVHLPHPTDCTRFIKCNWGQRHEMRCPSGQHWSVSQNWCDWPEWVIQKVIWFKNYSWKYSNNQPCKLSSQINNTIKFYNKTSRSFFIKFFRGIKSIINTNQLEYYFLSSNNVWKYFSRKKILVQIYFHNVLRV